MVNIKQHLSKFGYCLSGIVLSLAFLPGYVLILDSKNVV